jgi:endonuclease/exonuclease/phosphatase family metal-dependent hydrolase
VEYSEQHYSACNGVLDDANDCLASKGFQRIRLRLGPDACIDVYNTHLEAGNGEADNEARAVQVEQLLLTVADASADQAIIIMGDFNLSGSDAEDVVLVEQLLTMAGVQDICDALDCEEPGRIDRILFRSGKELQLEAVDWRIENQFVDSSGEMLSDHNAIGGNLRWARVEVE